MINFGVFKEFYSTLKKAILQTRSSPEHCQSNHKSGFS